MYNDELPYDEIKHNLFTSIKMINAVEEVMKVYDDGNKWAITPLGAYALRGFELRGKG